MLDIPPERHFQYKSPHKVIKDITGFLLQVCCLVAVELLHCAVMGHGQFHHAIDELLQILLVYFLHVLVIVVLLCHFLLLLFVELVEPALEGYLTVQYPNIFLILPYDVFILLDLVLTSLHPVVHKLHPLDNIIFKLGIFGFDQEGQYLRIVAFNESGLILIQYINVGLIGLDDLGEEPVIRDDVSLQLFVNVLQARPVVKFCFFFHAHYRVYRVD